MKVEIDLSENQSAAVAAVASHFGVTVAEIVLALTISHMNTSEEQHDLEPSIAEARDAIAKGKWQTTETQPFGWLEIPAPTVAVELADGESLELDAETTALLRTVAERHGMTPQAMLEHALGYVFADGPEVALERIMAAKAAEGSR